MADPLDKLPRLGVEALAPCCRCNRKLFETGVPLFFRYTIQQCGIDGTAVRQRAGEELMIGPLASVLGAAKDPVVVMATLPPQNLCHECAMADSEVLQAMSSVEVKEPS